MITLKDGKLLLSNGKYIEDKKIEPIEEEISNLKIDSSKSRTIINQKYSFNSTFQLNSVSGIKERYVIFLLIH